MSLIKTILKVGVPVALTAAAFAAAKIRELTVPSKEKPHSDAPIIVALGDSITFGSGVVKTRTSDSWETKLEKLLGGSYQVLNYGISGATLQDEGDCPYWNMPDKALQGYPEAALALNPEIVILMLGTNDSKPYNWNRERYEAQLDRRVKELKASPSVKRLILMCPPFACPADGSDTVAFDILNETIRDEIVPIVKKCAAENEVECIDLYALTEGHSEYFTDGVHPNSYGNRVIASQIHKHILNQ
ncbi:MAG: GDSL-type esterase/lipase family protein [Faecousia sp.]